MTDRFVVRSVVIVLGVIALAGMILIGILALDDKGVPDSLTAVTSAAAGALGALLSRTSSEPMVVEDAKIARADDDGDDFGGGVG